MLEHLPTYDTGERRVDFAIEVVGFSKPQVFKYQSQSHRPYSTNARYSRYIVPQPFLRLEEWIILAKLLRLLLQMAGAKQNPGPSMNWHWSACKGHIKLNETFVKCSKKT